MPNSSTSPSSSENRWLEALNVAFNGHPLTSQQWRSHHDMVRLLTPFMGHNLNHCMLPSGGGMDIERVKLSSEDGCLALKVVRGATYIAKPSVLWFEHIDQSPLDSFFLMELDELHPVLTDRPSTRLSEELVELSPGEYVDRDAWDAGHLGYDDVGRKIPLPPGARLVVRWLSGKMLLVAKRGLWNWVRQTYDGRHNRMTASEIRGMIVGSMDLS